MIGTTLRSAPVTTLAMLLLVGCGGQSPPTQAAAPETTGDEAALRVPVEVAPGPVIFEADGIRAFAASFEGVAYVEVVLGHAPAGTALPLVVALHGRGDAPRVPSAALVRTGVPMRVVLPRGPVEVAPGRAWSALRVRDGRFDELAADLSPLADLVARLAQHVAGTRPTAGTPIVTGFSQGAILAWVTVLRHPDAFGLALVAAGWAPPSVVRVAAPCTLARVRALHGLRDEIIPVGPTRTLVGDLSGLGCPVELVELPDAGHEMNSSMSDALEGWLEEALSERAPDRRDGLGVIGPDPEPVDLSEPPLFELPPDPR